MLLIPDARFHRMALVFAPSWLAGGASRAFVSSRDKDRQSITTLANGSQQISGSPCTTPDPGPSWPLDGSHIPCERMEAKQGELFAVSANGLDLTNRTQNDLLNVVPARRNICNGARITRSNAIRVARGMKQTARQHRHTAREPAVQRRLHA